MPAAVRLGDICTGHGAWPPRPNVSASPNVFINEIAAHRLGDAWAVHCDPTPSCHAGMMAAGSPNVYVNGLALARVGDPVNCGSLAAIGSPNTFING